MAGIAEIPRCALESQGSSSYETQVSLFFATLTMKSSVIAAAVLAALSHDASGQCEVDRIGLPVPTQTGVLGWSVAIEGDLAVIGAIGTDDACPMDPNCNSGTALVYRRVGGVWGFEAALTASDGGPADQFGQNCSISGDRILVGAHFDGPGSAYVFAYNGTAWVEEQKLLGSDSLDLFHFGHSVSLDGDTALIGCMRDNFAGPETGSAFIFERIAGVWTETAKLTASDPAERDRFGRSCDLQGGTAVIGAHLHDGAAADEGAAYVYERDDAGTPNDPSDDTWPQTAKLVSSQPLAEALFARAVGVDGNTCVIGSSQDTGATVNSGAVYIFERDASGAWLESQILSTPDGEDADRFGESVAIDGNRIVAGVPGDDDVADRAGAAYQIERIAAGWTVTTKFTSSEVDPSAALGTEMTVDVSGSSAVFGSPFGSLDIALGGSAYLVDLDGCLGDFYCAVTANSTGSEGLAELVGSTLVESNTLSFEVSSLPTNAFGYLLVSADPGFAMFPGGSVGNLCLSGAIGRYVSALFNTGATGTASTAIDLTALPSPTGNFAAAAGDELYFQAWHRDSMGGMATSNFSQAIRVLLH